jgi:hypothetical protein
MYPRLSLSLAEGSRGLSQTPEVGAECANRARSDLRGVTSNAHLYRD